MRWVLQISGVDLIASTTTNLIMMLLTRQKLTLLNYNNFSIAKLVVNKLDRVKITKVVSQQTRNWFLIN